MKVNSYLRLEATQLIPPLTYLNDKDNNTEIFHWLARRNLDTAFKVQGETVYRSTISKKTYEFFCLDFENRKVLYFSRLSVSDTRCFLHSAIKINRQSYVWVDPIFKHRHKGFARQCLWQLLFPLVPNILVSDKEQTIYGHTFWEALLCDGIAKNYCVIAFACLPDNRERYFTYLTDANELIYNAGRLKQIILGDGSKYQYRGFAICKRNIRNMLEKDVKITELDLNSFLKLDI